ncbi:venom allergen 5-like [Daphnia pulex]|uniref:venom allergen 5-like n=1 Tax=Daphnia pulex TaxID=6669 RepID=UPI001EDD956B|nr:venom allergen 5-like [Daphnia pulex]
MALERLATPATATLFCTKIYTTQMSSEENPLNTIWGEACQPAYPDQTIVADADIAAILKVHNDYRRKIAQGLETQGNPGPQPPASNMRELELAVMAVTIARQCVYKHDTCRDVPRFNVDQNINIGASSADTLNSTSNWNSAVTAWYSEVKDIDATYAASFPVE